MNMKDFLKKNKEELKWELNNLLREQFNLRMQFSTGKNKKSHLLKKVRRNIARVKTIIFNKKRSL